MAGNEVAARAPGRWLRLALAVSVAVNLAVAGAVIGAHVRGDPQRAPSVRDMGLGLYAAALSDDDRKALRRALIRQGPDLRAARAGLRDDVARVAGLVRAEPFEPEALRRAMAEGAGRTAGLLAQAQGLLVDHLATLPAAERAAFALRLEEAAARGPRRREGPPPEPRP